jgi:hypothetical protein
MAADSEAIATKTAIFRDVGFKGCNLLQLSEFEQSKIWLYSIDTAEPRFSVQGVRYIGDDVSRPILSDIARASPALIFKLAAVHTMA